MELEFIVFRSGDIRFLLGFGESRGFVSIVRVFRDKVGVFVLGMLLFFFCWGYFSIWGVLEGF